MKATVIGSGFSGLSSAAFLAQAGYSVNVIEKNSHIGGRARKFYAEDFMFDMGPSWYWMPDVFENFFNKFNKSTGDYYELIKLDPGFQIIFQNNETLQVPSNQEDLKQLFENIETGSSQKLTSFMKEAKFKYDFSMNSFIYNPGISWKEVIKKDIFQNMFRLQLFQSYKKHVAKYFKNEKLRALLEFPVLFLGTAPKDTPALYSLMAYSGLIDGTYYPLGGFNNVIKGMSTLCKELGVNFHTSENVQKIQIKNNIASHVDTNNSSFPSDIVIGSADYNHIENKLIDLKYRNYSQKYWSKRVFSPSCLLFYIGLNKKLNKVIHHNLFFDADIEQHIQEIYKDKTWPSNPLFYACCPSKTDPNVAPEGHENLFLLIPITPGLKDEKNTHEKYFQMIIKRLENYCGENIQDSIIYKKSYCINDFINDYNAYKGNAYGLANTLLQTANLKPSIVNQKVSNLYYTGQLTVPGPGVPPSLISGQIVAQHVINKHQLK